MKSTDPALIEYLASTPEICQAELYTIYLATARATPGLPAGSMLCWTTWDQDITIGDVTWSATGPQVSRGAITTSMTMEVPEVQLDCYFRDSDLVDGLTLGAFADNGGFIGAQLAIDWVVMPTPGVPTFVVREFTGPLGVAAPSASKVQLTGNGANKSLNVQYPLRLYQKPCLNTLYAADCGVLRTNFTWSNACAAGSTNLVLVPATNLSAMAGQSIAPDPTAFADGALTFTGGVNAGASRGIRLAADGSITLMYGLQHTPGLGDPFAVSYGCTHTADICGSRFNNAARYQGYPYIPPAETSA
ncbi:MAG: DUF2163 domain-containing protein [Azospirillaceae bacterium]|nr:DUF2163 domain-containing protein [Azospirillaceae bacterium]